MLVDLTVPQVAQPPVRWTILVCHESDCSLSTGPRIIDARGLTATLGDAGLTGVIGVSFGPSSSCSVHGMCVDAEVNSHLISFVTGTRYGIRVTSSDTGRVLYDGRVAVDFTQNECWGTPGCYSVLEHLADATLSDAAP